MSGAKHRIKRQLIELTVANEAVASQLHAQIRRVHERQLLPLIDRYCSELSDAERIYRIDKLEVDLGTISAENLEADFAARLAGPLRNALAEHIDLAQRSAGGENSAMPSSLELFEFFARTGSLPWWADTSQPRLLDGAVEDLLRVAPRPLARSLRVLSDEYGCLKRLVLHYPDALITRLVLLLMPDLCETLTGFYGALADLLQGSKLSAGISARTTVWTTILRTACREPMPGIEPEGFWRETLQQLAAATGVAYAVLVSGLCRSVETMGRGAGMPLGDIVQRLYLYKHIADKSQYVSNETNPTRTNQQDLLDLTFSDADELYIYNAGLVILWPFLENFFNRLDLIVDNQFKDEAAAQRAVGLLQYIAGEDESPLETLLPLNKVLCGMAPEEVFDFGAEITEQEKQECNDLIMAVIHQAPILNEMSSAGFRASFLLRQGQLSARDGNLLLRVERETHDIVLDRFPWSVSIVRLPWMEAMMQVEW